MGLIKEEMTDFGIAANYWKVSGVTIDRNTKKFNYTMNLYFIKDAKQFIKTNTYTLFSTNDDIEFDNYIMNINYPNIITACYEHAKTIEDFINAIDDI